MPGPVNINVLQNGKPLKAEYQPVSVDVLRECNRIPVAELVYPDGRIDQGKFPLADSGFFKIGNEIEIRVRYQEKMAKEQSIFKGIVVRQNLRMEKNYCVLEVEMSDLAIKLTAARKSQVFEKSKDSDVISKVLKAAGVKVGSVEATKVLHKKLVQYHASDWDFLLARAEANGLVVTVKDGEVSAKTPLIKGAPRKKIKLGLDSIYQFELESDARHQKDKISASAYQIKTHKMTAPANAMPFALNQRELNATNMAKPLGRAAEQLVFGAALDPAEVRALSQAAMIKAKMNVLRGHMRLQGDGAFYPGDLIQMTGVSTLFSGLTYVTGIRHQIDTDGWFTELQFGLPAEKHSEQYQVQEPSANGVLPGVNGLQVGIVEKFQEDPDNEIRFLVQVPSINHAANKIWARLAVMDAGKQHGFAFFPEAGDEVILGFFNDDPRQAVILGSMYSSVRTPFLKPTAKNQQKGLTTKTGFKIVFDEEKKQMMISTPGKQQVQISDEKKTIEILDANKNRVTLDKNGMRFSSAKNIELNAKAEINITASKGIKLKAPKVDVI